MPRQPHAAKTLTRQVREKLRRQPDSKVGLGTAAPDGEPDGFNVLRGLTFDKTASKVIEAAQSSLEADARIESVEIKGGVATVTFTGKTIADDRAEFDLDAVEESSEEEPTP